MVRLLGGGGGGRARRGGRSAGTVGYAKCYVQYVLERCDAADFIAHVGAVTDKCAAVAKAGSKMHPHDVCAMVAAGGEPITQHALFGIKEEVRADRILTGGEFSKPFTDKPPTYLVSAGCAFFAHLTPGLELDLLCDEPYYVATLGGTVTTLRADAPEDAPDPTSDVSEDNARMGGEFAAAGAAGASVSRPARTPPAA